MKRQKSVPEDLRKAEEDRGSPTELDIRRPFEEEVCPFLSPKSLVPSHGVPTYIMVLSRLYGGCEASLILQGVTKLEGNSKP